MNELCEYQNARCNDKNLKKYNNPFEILEQFIYLGKTITNRNVIHEEIKSILKSGNACYHSVQNLLSWWLLSKYIYKEYDTHNDHAVCCFIWM